MHLAWESLGHLFFVQVVRKEGSNKGEMAVCFMGAPQKKKRGSNAEFASFSSIWQDTEF